MVLLDFSLLQFARLCMVFLVKCGNLDLEALPKKGEWSDSWIDSPESVVAS